MNTFSIPVTGADRILDPASVAERWVANLNAAITDKMPMSEAFVPDSWWRDLFACQWDIRVHSGLEAIADGAHCLKRSNSPTTFSLDGQPAPFVASFGGQTVINVMFGFNTDLGQCRGVARLLRGPVDGKWKAWTFMTQLDNLHGFDESAGKSRPQGIEHGERRGRVYWHKEQRERRQRVSMDPDVVIVGGGHSGLSLAARLDRLGISSLVVEKNPRVGDNWRNRYESLTLHDPIWTNHLPYMPFPDSWPLFVPKDMMGDWLELYSEAMGLNVLCDATASEATFDTTENKWSVPISTGAGEDRLLRPKHLVMAIGINGGPDAPIFDGAEDFDGALLHSSQYRTGADWRGSRAVVIGAGTSGHDIAQDLYEQGASEVTVLQRSSTMVVSSDTYISAFRDTYDSGNYSVDDADMLVAATPFALVPQVDRFVTAQWRQADAQLLDDLARTDYRLDFGPGEAGLMAKHLSGRNGYYIDIGMCGLISAGKVKVAQGADVDHLAADGVHLTDGRFLPADLVVAATGFETLEVAARRLIGNLADELGPIYKQDSEGEMAGAWRPTGVNKFWVMVGNLQRSRYFSKFLAMQIAATEFGLVAPEFNSSARNEELDATV